ncbi:MAG: DUF1573 domain-containing protein, partial [Flavobacteriales bacterium]|nr:DUF1573 domain-containing protein [Flavobacteriales bacterium]
MKYSYTFIALAVVAFIVGGCNNDASEKTASRPAGTKVDANDIPVNTSPGQKETFDPAKNTVQAPAGPTTVMTFAAYDHDFGTLEEGESATHIFEFTNTGTEPLILDKCKGSCGCT